MFTWLQPLACRCRHKAPFVIFNGRGLGCRRSKRLGTCAVCSRRKPPAAVHISPGHAVVNETENYSQQLRSTLGSLAALSDCGPTTIAKLAALGNLLAIPAGTVMFTEGDRHVRCYFVVQGCIRLEMETASHGRQSILSMGRGDLLAWSALIGDNLMTTTAVAATQSEVIAFDGEALNVAMEADPTFGYQCMRSVAKALSRRLLATRLQMLDVYRR